MKPSEVIERLQRIRQFYLDTIKDDTAVEAVDMAIKAVEKQIPKPVKITTSTIRCGECNRQLSGIGNIHSERNYCQGCGQAIKWEKE